MTTDHERSGPSEEVAPGLPSQLTSRCQALAWLGAAGAAVAAVACGGGSNSHRTTAAADRSTVTTSPADTPTTAATTATGAAPATGQEIWTGVPMATALARRVTSALFIRRQPLLTAEPMRPGELVPCMAIWPTPVPKLISTSEKAATESW